MTATLALAWPPTHSHAVPAAASTAIADLLTGRGRPARVVASTRHALVFAAETTGSDDEPSDELSLVCLSSPQAVKLPCGLIMPTGPPSASVGTPGTIGAGMLRFGPMTVSVGRWWRVPEPRIANPAVARNRAAAMALPPLESSLARPAQQLAQALHSDGDLDTPVRALLGLGCGLTPGGDDVIAGALVALHAVGAPSALRLSATVAEAAPMQRTTAISAGLLLHAARGECVPELAAFLAALDNRGQLRHAMHRLLEVGHSSGTALCHGAVLAVAGLPTAVVSNPPPRQPSRASARHQPADPKDNR